MKEEKIYSTFFQKAINGLVLFEVVFDLQGRPANYVFLKINPAFEAITGLKQHSTLRQKASGIMPQIGLFDEYILAKWNYTVVTGETTNHEIYFPSLNRYHGMSAYRIANNRIIVEYSDISERKRVEKSLHEKNAELQSAYENLQGSLEEVEAIAGELEESQQKLIIANLELRANRERLELALWAANTGMWDWLIKTDELIINHRFAEIYGYNLNEFNSNPVAWENRVHQDDYQQAMDKVIAHLKGITPHYEAEYRIKNKSGQWLWIHDSGKVVERDKYARALRATGIIQEINQRKLDEQALNNSRAIYQGIFNTTNNAILLADFKDYSIIDANPAAEKLSLYSCEELRKINFTDLSFCTTDKARHIFKDNLGELHTGNTVIECQCRKKNGESVPVAVHLNLMPSDIIQGEIHDILLIVIFDLSEQLQYQQEKETRARFEAEALKMTTLSAMSAGVIHEISQPLNAIKILADGINFWHETGETIDMEEAFAAFQNISYQTERIKNIIIHMRSSMANPVKAGDYYPCNINDAVSGTMKMLGRQLSSHGITVNLDLDRHEPMVCGQEQCLEEIIINLFTNAMQALDEQSQAEKIISCKTRSENNQVILEVANNGPPIDPEHAQQIWEPFFSTRKTEAGMGLGLTIVYSIITRLKGKISHYTNDWGGPTFRIELPSISQP